MKKTFILLLCPLMMACGGSEQKETATEPVFESEVNVTQGVVEMADYHYSDTTSWNGNIYRYTITRNSIDTPATVKDDDEVEYRDNKLSLQVESTSTASPKTIWSGEWLKQDLAAYIDAAYLRHSVIEGMAFYRTDASGMHFVLTVGLPESDEYVQLRVTVSYNGNVTLVKDEFLED